MVMPTPDEIKNGWTEKSLTQFLEEQGKHEQKRYEESMHGPRKPDGSFYVQLL